MHELGSREGTRTDGTCNIAYSFTPRTVVSLLFSILSHCNSTVLSAFFFFFFLVPSQSLSQSTEIRAEITDVLTGITDALLLQQKHFQVDSEPAARCHAIWVVPRMAPVIRTSEVTESTQNFPSGHLSQTQCTSSARRPALRVSRNIPGRLVHLLQRLPNTFRSHNNNNKILF